MTAKPNTITSLSKRAKPTSGNNKCYKNGFHKSLEEDSALDDVSPNETEARDDAQTRAFLAPLWKFLVLHTFSLLQTLFTSIRCSARPMSCRDSPKIPIFRWGMCANQIAIIWDAMFGKRYRKALDTENIIETSRNGSLEEISFNDAPFQTPNTCFSLSRLHAVSSTISTTGSSPIQKTIYFITHKHTKYTDDVMILMKKDTIQRGMDILTNGNALRYKINMIRFNGVLI